MHKSFIAKVTQYVDCLTNPCFALDELLQALELFVDVRRGEPVTLEDVVLILDDPQQFGNHAEIQAKMTRQFFSLSDFTQVFSPACYMHILVCLSTQTGQASADAKNGFHLLLLLPSLYVPTLQ